jgi:hypothetical protein
VKLSRKQPDSRDSLKGNTRRAPRVGGLASISLATLFVLPALLALGGCTNNLNSAANRLLASSLSQTTGGTETSDASPVLVLSRVQKNKKDPTATFDLLGDGSGSMGEMCTSSNAATQETTCVCAYDYFNSGGNKASVEVPTTYHERDLLRCSYASIPADVSYVSVRVRVTTLDAKSNEVTFKLAGSGVTLDSSSTESFSQVQRYQCRDIVTIYHPWTAVEKTVYDPILSEDPRYSYPLNFYTTNMGKTMAQYAAADGPKGWNCPPMPNDTGSGMDLSLFSVAADATGSKQIFPPQSGAFDRSTFFLMRAKSGVFSVPINAYVMPTVSTRTPDADGKQPDGTVPPIGYGARPVVKTTDPEACPDSTTPIPQGFHWAKLWLFRKQLPKRSYPFAAKLMLTGQISCNSPPWLFTPKKPAPNDTLFNDCSGASHVGALDPITGMAARFFENTAMCVKPTPGGSTDPATGNQYNGSTLRHPNPGTSGVDFTVYAQGTDTFVANSKNTFGCGGAQAQDPTHVCSASTGQVAFDSTIPTVTGPIDKTSEGSRFDYLFVVTPTSVNRSAMDPTSASSIYQTYTPIRFISPNDCKSPDPDNPLTPGDCSSSRMMRYELKKHEIGASGNPGQDDANRPGDFPVCVLQPN